MSADYSPAAQRRAVHDEEQRDWLLGPALAAIAKVGSDMAQGFDELKQAVAAVASEGGDMSGTQQAVLAAITALQDRVTGVQSTLDSVNSKLAAAGMEAGVEAAQLQSHKAALDAMEQALNDAAAAATQPAPSPAPAPPAV